MSIEFLKNLRSLKGLKELILEHDIPDDAQFITERVEDVYYEEHNWEADRVIEGFPGIPSDFSYINQFTYDKDTNEIIVWVHI